MHNTIIFGLNPMIVSTAILVVVYFILFTEKVNRAIIALLGACAMMFVGILNQQQAIAGIDFNTLALLIGMMTIVGISAKSGMFQYIAAWSAKIVKANPRGMLLVLGTVTALLSAFLDNVTTVLLIVPVTIQITKQLKVNPYPFFLLEIFASNIGGTATLIGDPPNILLGSALDLSFMDFVYNLTPCIIICMIVVLIIFDIFWGRRIKYDPKDQELVMQMNEKEFLTDIPLLKKSLFVLFMVIAGFISAEHINVANGTIAVFGAALLLLLHTIGHNHQKRDHMVEHSLNLIDWTTIFFFAGLFVIVTGLEHSGILSIAGQNFVDLTQGSINKAALAILWISAIFSAAIDNIPFMATMIPIIKSMEPSMGGREAMMPVWWSLSLGACLGGNGTIIGASANVIVAGIATRENHPMGFLKFMIWSVPIMLITVAISTAYVYLVYLN